MRIKNIDLKLLIVAVANVYSCAELCRYLGLSSTGGTLTRLNKTVKNLNLDTTHWTGPLWNKGKSSLDDNRVRKKPVEQIFADNSNASASYVRKLILNKKLIEYKCACCNLIDNWNGKKLNLQLDHINGKRNDHRLENLRWLCPNCHSQTETFCARNITKKNVSDSELIEALKTSPNIRQALIKVDLNNGQHYKRAKKLIEKYGLVGELAYPSVSNTDVQMNIVGSSPTGAIATEHKLCVCGNKLKKRNKYCSYSCSHKATEKVQWENFDLLKLSSEYSVEHIGRMLKVSGNAVRKRLKKLKRNSLQRQH